MSMDRRTFIRTCTGTVATAAVSGSLIERLASAGDLVSYTKSRLVDADGTPIKASALLINNQCALAKCPTECGPTASGAACNTCAANMCVSEHGQCTSQ